MGKTSQSRTARTSARHTQDLKNRIFRRRKPILHEERVYADVLPFVRLYQGFWLLGTAAIGLDLVYGWLIKDPAFNELVSVVTRITALVVFTAVFLWVSFALCRMSRVLGWIVLIVCALFGFSTIRFLIGFVPFLGGLARASGSGHWQFPAFFILLVFLHIAWGYFLYLTVRAGWHFSFLGNASKRIVAEIDPIPRFPSDWFSKVIGMPIPRQCLTKNRRLATFLFMASGLAFSLFTVIVAPSFFVVILRTRDLYISVDTATGTIGKLGGLILIAFASLFVSRGLRAAARRLLISSIPEAQQYDRRSPILFLRSFRDDQVTLPTPRMSLLGRLFNLSQNRGSVDVILLEEGTPYGPVIALGESTESTAPYGASRGYVDHKNWQRRVVQLVEASRCVVICLGHTEGIIWELEYLLKSGFLRKTLFLIDPGARHLRNNKSIMRSVVEHLRTIQGETQSKSYEVLLDCDEPVIGFYFDEGQRPKVGVSLQFSEASYVLMVRWFLRTAMDGELQPD